ncbi:MAG: hypothetical protein QOD54_1576 [Sphingomonadales bacterium]|nr:hypothetical protein [Sphingomonadales bacterium]
MPTPFSERPALDSRTLTNRRRRLEIHFVVVRGLHRSEHVRLNDLVAASALSQAQLNLIHERPALNRH